MKSTLSVLLFVLSLTSFGATLSQMVGTYEISNPNLPIVNVVTLDEDGNVTLLEKSPFGEFQCSGSATLSNDILESEVTCENGMAFTQRIDLQGITNFSQFTAPVYSSLYDAEVPMNFKKL